MVAAGLLSASCGELEQPAAFSPTTSSTLATGVEQETASQVQERPGVSVGVDEFVPTPPADYVSSLLVSSAAFVFSVDSGLSAPLAGSLNDVQATRAVDDFDGGLVIQNIGGEIVHRPDQSEAEVLIPAEEGDRLLDVGFWGASPQVMVQVGERQVDRIQLVTERPGDEREREVHLTLADDEEIVALSASRDLQAVIVKDSQCGELRFYGSDGEIIPIADPEPPPCELPGLPSFGAVALSPDGDAVAYTLVSYRSDTTEAGTDLVVRELIVASDFLNLRIGEAGDSITSLAFDGDRAGYLRTSAGAQSVTLLDLVARAELPVDLIQAGDISSLSFARMPVTPTQ
jgi:hypothetical protein